MRALFALLISLPLTAVAQTAPPPASPPPAAQPQAAQAPLAQPAQPAQPPPPAAVPGPPPPAYAPPAPLASPAPPRRDTWYIGFGLGSGGGEASSPNVTVKLSDVAPDPTTVFLNFKVGVTLNPSMLVGLDVAAIRAQGDVSTLGGTVTHALQTTNYDAMFTWFPMERGLFLRGGAGVSRITEELGSGSQSWGGVNLDVGVGYAFWLGRTFNLTVNLDHSRQSFSGSDGPTKGNFTALWLGFDWY